MNYMKQEANSADLAAFQKQKLKIFRTFSKKKQEIIELIRHYNII